LNDGGSISSQFDEYTQMDFVYRQRKQPNLVIVEAKSDDARMMRESNVRDVSV